MSVVPRRANIDRPYHEMSLATTREVYPTGDGTVIKVPKKHYFVETNRREVENWLDFGDERIMAPIVDWHEDYEWIEMVECYRLSRPGDNHFVEKFKEKLSEFDVPLIDLHAENLGLHPETRAVVCLDYPDLDETEPLSE